MVNLDPETAEVDPAVMKAAVRLNQNNAGVYGTVVNTGGLSVGKKIYLRVVLRTATDRLASGNRIQHERTHRRGKSDAF